MQDDDASKLVPSDNRWMVTLFVVAFAQGLSSGGISLVFPFFFLFTFKRWVAQIY